MHITTSYQIMIINTCFCFRPRKLAHIRPYRGLCTFLGVSHITASYQIINIGTAVFAFGQENSHIYNPYRGFTHLFGRCSYAHNHLLPNHRHKEYIFPFRPRNHSYTPRIEFYVTFSGVMFVHLTTGYRI